MTRTADGVVDRESTVASPGYDATRETRRVQTWNGDSASPARTFQSEAVPSSRLSLEAAAEESSRLAIVVLHSNQALVLAIAGSIDRDTAPRLRRALELALVTSPRLVVVDLSAVRLLACAGLSVLVAAHLLAEDRTCLRVVADRRATRRPLVLTGVDRCLSVCRTRAEALAEPLLGR